MKFTVYILASILSHLLLIGSLYFTHPFTDTEASVFNVDIVSPQEITRPEETESAKKPPASEKKPPIVRRRRRPPEKELPPETMYGGAARAEEKGSDRDEPDKDTKPDSLTESEGPITSESDSEDSVSGEKEGFTLAPPSHLFDKQTIEKFAGRGPDRKEKTGLTFDTSEFRHRGYMRMLKERIESIWKYPKEAARHGISGDLYMKFSITRDGGLGAVELLRTSGHRELDEAAMKAVKEAQPFWPLPDDWKKETLEIKGHFIYIYGDTLVL